MDPKALAKLTSNMQAYTNGEISYEELVRRNAAQDAKNHWTTIVELAESGKWEAFCTEVMLKYEVMPKAFRIYYNDIPSSMRRSFALGCYSNHGDSVPGCRKAVRELERNGINELPPEYANQTFITVYRAGEEPINKAKFRLSWTLSYEVAKTFRYELRSRHANDIFRAKIRPCDVIAYLDDRNEQEVIQYRKVFDVEIVERTQ